MLLKHYGGKLKVSRITLSFIERVIAVLLNTLCSGWVHNNYGRIYMVDPLLIDSWCELPTYSLLQWKFFYAGEWDLLCKDLMDRKDFQYTYSRYVDGIDWSDTGSFEHMKQFIERNGSFDGWQSDTASIVERHRQLDNLYDSVKREGRLKFTFEVKPLDYRVDESICGLMTRSGRLVFGGAGQHRLAIARILKIKLIPIYLAAVHVERKSDWQEYLEQYL